MKPESAAQALLLALKLPKWAASVLVRSTGHSDELVLWVDEGWIEAIHPPTTFEGFSVKVEPRPRLET